MYGGDTEPSIIGNVMLLLLRLLCPTKTLHHLWKESFEESVPRRGYPRGDDLLVSPGTFINATFIQDAPMPRLEVGLCCKRRKNL